MGESKDWITRSRSLRKLQRESFPGSPKSEIETNPKVVFFAALFFFLLLVTISAANSKSPSNSQMVPSEWNPNSTPFALAEQSIRAEFQSVLGLARVSNAFPNKCVSCFQSRITDSFFLSGLLVDLGLLPRCLFFNLPPLTRDSTILVSITIIMSKGVSMVFCNNESQNGA